MYYHINDINIFVRDEGDGQPVLLFLHFWGGSSATWSSVISRLKEDHRCISYDSRGWGKSDKPESGYSIDALGNDTLKLIETLGLNNYILIGHSMGGKVAQYVAAQKPAGLKKLILVAPSPSLSTILPPEILTGMRNAYTSLANINETIDRVFRAADIPHELRDILVKGMMAHNEYSRLGWTDIALPQNISEGVAQIDVPTLIIAGENDIVDPPERLEAEVKALIPGSRMIVIGEVGHLSMLQEPEKVASLIRDFVSPAFESKEK